MRLISFFDHEQVNLKTRKLSKYAKKTEEINESYFGMGFCFNLDFCLGQLTSLCFISCSFNVDSISQRFTMPTLTFTGIQQPG
jgi:hypothetical protein